MSNQQVQKICREKVYRIKFFRANLEKCEQNIFRTSKNLPALTPTSTYIFKVFETLNIL